MSESPLYAKIIKKLEKGTKEKPSIQQDLLIRICANQGEIYARRKEKAECLRIKKIVLEKYGAVLKELEPEKEVLK